RRLPPPVARRQGRPVLRRRALRCSRAEEGPARRAGRPLARSDRAGPARVLPRPGERPLQRRDPRRAARRRGAAARGACLPRLAAPMSFWTLPAASDTAQRVDRLFFALLGVTGTVTLAIFVLMIFFSIRFRRGSRAARERPPTSNRALELGWTLTPLALFVGIFVWAAGRSEEHTSELQSRQ